MSSFVRNAARWLLAAVLTLSFAWVTSAKVFAPHPWAESTPPDGVLDSPVVVPPNYTNFGFTPRELLALLAKRGFTVRWERQGSERFVLGVGGENRLTMRPLDLALQLRRHGRGRGEGGWPRRVTGDAAIPVVMSRQLLAGRCPICLAAIVEAQDMVRSRIGRGDPAEDAGASTRAQDMLPQGA